MKKSELLIVGSLAFDDLEMPTGSFKDVLGGAATYSSISASFLSSARIVGVVGEDFGEPILEDFRKRGIDTTGVERAKGKSFRWHGRYADDLMSRTTLDTQLNVFADFNPKIPSAFTDADYVFLANIEPTLQLGVLQQMRKPKLVAMDTMNFWIEGRLDALKQVLARVDLLVINDEEARLLAGAGASHNLNEVANAAIALIRDPETTLAGLMKSIKGPDFPGGGQITSSRDEIKEAYSTGRGAVRVRARWTIEKLSRGQWQVVVHELPPGTSSRKVLEQIANQMRQKKLPMVDDLRDESDHENPTRLVIVPKSNRVDIPALMAHLFATTDLERTYRVNLNVIGLDGRPRVMGLKELLLEWLEFRMHTVTRRLTHRLGKLNARLHILDGLLIAYLNLDEVIRIVRTEDKPKPVLMKRFKLSDEQAEAILETKLRHLARLEEMKIREEQKELAEERDEIDKILKSKARLKKLVRDELLTDAEEYGDERRTKLVERDAAQAIAATDLLSSEPTTVVLSRLGWVRAAKGHDIDARALSYKTGDEFQAAAKGRNLQQAVFIDSTGRAYSLDAHTLPAARGYGEPLSGTVDPPDGATFAAVLIGEPTDTWLIASDAGYGFRVTLAELYARNRKGKSVLKVPENATVLPACPVGDPRSLAVLVNNSGEVLALPVESIEVMASGKGMNLYGIPGKKSAERDEYLTAMAVVAPDAVLTVYSGKSAPMTLKYEELKQFQDRKGQRRQRFSRAYKLIDRLEVGA